MHTKRITRILIILAWLVFAARPALSLAAPLPSDPPTDPLYNWHTFYGSLWSAGYEEAYAIDFDAAGNIYIVGTARENWYGPGDTPPLHPTSGIHTDLVVIKLDAAGAYQWHTFYGSGATFPNDMAVDAAGNIHITGATYDTWLGDNDAPPLHEYAGGAEIFAMQLDPNGAYQWHSFYGSSNNDFASSIDIDAGGNVYIASMCRNPWLGDGAAPPLHPHGGLRDINVLKLDSSGAYQWHTFYGTYAGWEYGNDIAVAADGRVSVIGLSTKTWLGDGDTPPLHAHSGGIDDLHVLQLDAAGAYQWHTFYGSDTGWEYGNEVGVDGSGNLYLVAESDGTWNGDGDTAPLHPHSGMGNLDLTLIKLDSSGAYQWHTFYGSDLADEIPSGIVIDPAGNIYLSALGPVDWLGDGDVASLHAHSGGDDFLVLKLDSAGAYQWHTFYGSGLANYGTNGAYGLAVRGSSLAVSGSSPLSWLGDGDTQPLNPHSGWQDLAVLMLDTSGAYQRHTFYGNLGNRAYENDATRLETDGAGNLYVGGSSSGWLAQENTPPLHAYSGNADIFVLKLDSSGAPQWHTFYGSGLHDNLVGFARDDSDNLYIAGYSEAGWLGDGGALPLNPHPAPGEMALVVIKLDKNGLYQWHTFFATSDEHLWAGLALDDAGSIYVSCESDYPWLGEGGAAPRHPFSGGSNDLTVIKLDTDGAYQWHTFYGSDLDSSLAGEIAIGAGGQLYVTGASFAPWLGDGNAAPLHAFSAEPPNAFVVQLGADGAYQWHTFYGDASIAAPLDIDAAGDLYLGGVSGLSWDADGAPPLHAHSDGANDDILVMKLDSRGAYQWHTFYGASDGWDYGNELIIGPDGELYVVGNSGDDWLGDGDTTALNAYNGMDDITLLNLDPDGAYQWHTFYGSYDSDYGYSVAIDKYYRINLGGSSWAAWDSPDGAPPIHPHSGDGDMEAVIMQIDLMQTVSVALDGTGSGTVTSDPPGIKCRPAPASQKCSADFAYGSMVTLTAEPDKGSTFAGWGGACQGTGICQVPVTQVQQVTATFMLETSE